MISSAALVIVAAVVGSIALVVGTSSVPVSKQVLAVMHAQSRVDYTIVAPSAAPSGVESGNSAGTSAVGTAPVGTSVLDATLAYLSTPGAQGRELCWVVALDPPPGTVLGVEHQTTNFDVVIEDAATGYPIENWSGYSAGVHQGASDLSTIAASLIPPSKAFSSPGLIAANAGITVGAILFVTFPSQIFNRTFEEVYDDLRDWFERKVPRLRRFRTSLESRPSTRRDEIVFVGTMLVGSLLGALLDKGFGLNVGSLAGFAAMVLALVAGVAIPAVVEATYRHVRHKDAVFRLHALPAGIAVATVCVLVSRLTDFRPGYLYGIVCGVVFGRQLAKHEHGHIVALSALATLAVSVGAWFAWVPVFSHANHPGANLGYVLADDFLAAAFVSGLVGSVFSLLPLRFLPGGDLAGWHRGAWVAVFAASLFLLVQVMLRPVTSAAHPGSAPAVTAVVLFVVFGGISIAMRAYVLRKQARAA